MTLEPEPGRPGDRAILETLTRNGLSIELVEGTAKVLIGIAGVRAGSAAEASAKARDRVRQLVPAGGYRISEPVEAGNKELVSLRG
jgi:hypothetical protein